MDLHWGIPIDPHVGSFFMILIWLGGVASGGHVLPLHWLLKNQVSGIRKPMRRWHVSKESAKAADRFASCMDPFSGRWGDILREVCRLVREGDSCRVVERGSCVRGFGVLRLERFGGRAWEKKRRFRGAAEEDSRAWEEKEAEKGRIRVESKKERVVYLESIGSSAVSLIWLISEENLGRLEQSNPKPSWSC